MSNGPKLFRCHQCSQTYLSHDAVPDCPRCGRDDKEVKMSGMDGTIFLLTIIGILAFLLTASYYRGILGTEPGNSSYVSQPVPGQPYEKLPGSVHH